MKLVHQLAVALNQPEEKITLLLQRGVAVKNFKPLVDELYEYLDELPGE